MLSKEKQEMLKYYNLGLAAYREQRWDDGIKAFDMALAAVPDDGPSKLYKQRCMDYKHTPPPPNWDGVFTMTTK